ncbi:cse1 domain-containing protein [Ditylenchus destructor]|nr:cse1 domain-containing protein [Ditylenchus destructor]
MTAIGPDPLSQIAQLLNATLSVDNATRRNAENEIKRLWAVPGVATIYIQLIRNEQAPPEIRMAASLALKNFVRENWSGDGEAPLAEDEREELRQGVLDSLFQISAQYRKQMSQTVCIIGKYDFPERWGRLIEVIGECLSGDAAFDRLTTALSTLEELVKRYRHEMKSVELWKEILLVLKVVAEPLTQLYARMILHIPQDGQPDNLSVADRFSWLDVVLHCAKIYHSLVSQDIPEHFEDNLTPWMDGFLALLRLKLPTLESQADDTEPTSLDRLKCEICEIVTLFSQRYEECFENYAQQFIGAIWQLLVETDSRTRFDALVNAALGFLSAICQRAQYVHHFQGEGVLQAICENVIIQNLMLRQEDVEMFQQEPFEFLKRDIEGSDLETRRRGATEFVRALCRQFEQQVFGILSGAIGTFLADYQQNPTANFVRKDVVYYLVSAMASKAATARHGATTTSQLINVSDFYEQHVRGDLLDGGANEVPILRSDALKYLVLFRHQLQPEFLAQCICGKDNDLSNSIIRLLGSQHVLLHHYVAYAIERLLIMRDQNGQLLLNAQNVPVRALIEGLFECFNNQAAYNTHYIMKALMRCFSIIDAEIATNAHVYVQRLDTMIQQAIANPINPQLIHFIFESLCVLIRKAYTRVEGGLDKHVIQIVMLIIPKDVVDFVPYALQIIALLLDQSGAERQRGQPVDQEQYLPFLPYMLKGDFWARPANIPALMLVFESYIANFPATHGFRLANAILNYIDQFEGLTSRELLLPMLNRMQQQKTTKYTRQFVLFLCRFAALKSGQALANALEAIQAGVFCMVMEKILVTEMKCMPQTTTYEEKRLLTIGVAAIVRDTVNIMGHLYGPLVECAVGILEAFDPRHKPPAATEAGDELEDQYTEAISELEYSDPYCKLSYAQHPDTLGHDIPNIKVHLAQAVLVGASQANPASLDCLSAKVQSTLRAYASSS